MDKKLVCAISLLLEVSIAHAGACNFGKLTIDDITCYGPAKLINTVVNGKVTVAGPLALNHSRIKSIEAAGETNMNGSDVSGNTNILGPLIATETNFNGNLVITADKAKLSASSVTGSLTMEFKQPESKQPKSKQAEAKQAESKQAESKQAESKQAESKPTEAVLELACKSEILGGVIFKGKPGIIKKSADSEITGGIENGKIMEFIPPEKCD